MTQKDLNIIQATAKGFSEALDLLSSDYGDAALSEALCRMQEPSPKVLRSREIGYLAAMFLAWKQRGCPDLLT
jgi:hypothetical protein